MDNLTKFSDFGLCVKTKLLQINRTQKWLAEEVASKTGLYVDSGYMYKILTNQRNAPKVVDAICEILNISTTNVTSPCLNKMHQKGV